MKTTSTQAIQKLDAITITKMSAGEVIDRPASIVKELIENSIDAGATLIQVDIEAGGSRLIQVQDNGCGIPKDDLLLAPVQHATSKLQNIEDLYTLHTLGFRGEALASICHVAKLTITSATDESNGHKLHASEGQISDITPCPHPKGTTMTVQDLFHSVPVRQRFLKSPATELSYIKDVIIHHALLQPTIDMVLHHNGAEILNTSGITSLKERLALIYDKALLPKFIQVEAMFGPINVQGIISNPTITFPNRTKQLIGINKRPIKSPIIQKAIQQAYRDVIPQNRHALAILNLTLPTQECDINIHPQKQDIKVINSGILFDSVNKAIKLAFQRNPQTTYNSPHIIPEKAPHSSTLSNSTTPTNGPTPIANHRQPIDPKQLEHLEQVAIVQAFEKREQDRHNKTPDIPDPITSNAPTLPENELEEAHSLFSQDTYKAIESEQFEYLQVFNTYILVKSPTGLWILDQHAVHERILYEQIKMSALAETKTQPLLISNVFTLEKDIHALCLESAALFDALHIKLEDFGNNQIIVREVPLAFTDTSVEPLILDLLTHIKTLPGSTPDLLLTQKDKLQMIACKAAIKAGKTLHQQEIKHLLSALIQSPSRFTCPHGRPLFVKWGKPELEQLFDRR